MIRAAIFVAVLALVACAAMSQSDVVDDLNITRCQTEGRSCCIAHPAACAPDGGDECYRRYRACMTDAGL